MFFFLLLLSLDKKTVMVKLKQKTAVLFFKLILFTLSCCYELLVEKSIKKIFDVDVGV